MEKCLVSGLPFSQFKPWVICEDGCRECKHFDDGQTCCNADKKHISTVDFTKKPCNGFSLKESIIYDIISSELRPLGIKSEITKEGILRITRNDIVYEITVRKPHKQKYCGYFGQECRYWDTDMTCDVCAR